MREPRLIPEYGTKYRVWPDGRVERRHQSKWVEVSQWDDPPRVTLFRLGTRWQPRVHTLVDRLFLDPD